MAVEQRAPRERVAVAPEARARDPDEVVTGTHALGQQLRALGHTHREAHEVEVARRHGIRVLGHLAADERAAGAPTSIGDATDDRVDHLRHQLADGDVVEEEERLGTLRRNVVGGTDQVDADRVVPVHHPGDQRLRTDAVGGRHHHRIALRELAEREQPAEATDVAHDLGSEGGPDVRLDQLDGLLARGDVDARVRVRQRVVRIGRLVRIGRVGRIASARVVRGRHKLGESLRSTICC